MSTADSNLMTGADIIEMVLATAKAGPPAHPLETRDGVIALSSSSANSCWAFTVIANLHVQLELSVGRVLNQPLFEQMVSSPDTSAVRRTYLQAYSLVQSATIRAVNLSLAGIEIALDQDWKADLDTCFEISAVFFENAHRGERIAALAYALGAIAVSVHDLGIQRSREVMFASIVG